MKIYETNSRPTTLIEQLLIIWEASVRATHLFLNNEEILAIKEYVPDALTNIPHLIVAEDDQEQPIAFMGIAEQTLEMLFIAPTMRGQGIGKQLIQYGINTYGINHVAVNEQNPEAKGFYEHMGFSVYKRTELDEQGNPYPLLYMELKNRQ